ncbi:hypothetical protein V1514DRAFT_354238 [Lipomyces japonicus]|uniref:uncharacterized protein n=1 Tax=Lipomyces japonicus TaxID=56871 RepID=UPI0034CF6520
MYLPRTHWSISFLSVVVIEAVVVLALEGYVFGKFEANINANIDAEQRKNSNTGGIPTYLALFIFAEVYKLVLSWDALRLKNTIQCIGICLFNTAVLVYAGIQYEQLKQAAEVLSALRLISDSNSYVLDGEAWGDIMPFLIAVIAVIGFAGFVMAYITVKLYNEFGWSIYKQIGADLRMKQRYLYFQIFITLLKLDFFFFLGFTIQFIVIVLNTKDVEFGLTIAVIPATILILYLSQLSVRHELKYGTSLSIFFFFAGMAYFLFKLVRMYQPSQSFKYVAARKSLTVFAVITLFLIVITIINIIICASNFDKGLKQYVVSTSKRLRQRQAINSPEKIELEEINSVSPLSPLKRRMTLD